MLPGVTHQACISGEIVLRRAIDGGLSHALSPWDDFG
jgi:hypothetical protein